MSPVDPEIPPAGEEIHLPGGTVLPLLLTIGITMTLIGVTTQWYLVALGLILTVVVIVRWTLDTKRDVDHLPLDHGSH
ncbi:MAG: hypothetical protein JWP17_1377 [Solirubrobacterales bacterium]|jgi:hypothetical protein|nr:hypothetical protein [Solirubrobacterales bacterium]